MAFASVETDNQEVMMEVDIGGPLEPIHGYSMFKVLDAEEPIQVASDTERKKQKVRTLHQPRRMVLADRKWTRVERFRARSMSYKELSCVTVLCPIVVISGR